MKKFFKFCWYKKSELLVLFVANLFVAEYLFEIFKIFKIVPMVLVAIVLTFGIIVYGYLNNKDYFKRLYVKVCIEYKIRDEYKNYSEIKKIIETYMLEGQLNVKQNIAVIESAIEKEKAFNIFNSALLTICGAIIGVVYGENIFINLQMMIIYVLLFLMYYVVGSNIPRSAFIRKVIDSIDIPEK